MKLYVATTGEYSDYHVVGIFSSYKLAAKHSDHAVYVTTLDKPEAKVGAWGCYIVVRECRSYDSAPSSSKLPAILTPGMILLTEFYDGVPLEKEMEWYAKGRVAIVYASTKEGAKRKALDYAGASQIFGGEAAAEYNKYIKTQENEAACADEGHKWAEWISVSASNSSIGPYKHRSCTRCKERETERTSFLMDVAKKWL